MKAVLGKSKDQNALVEDVEEQRQTTSQKVLTKTADKKGRIVLGTRFANRAVIIQKLNETEMIIKLARVIPESEAWLYDNAEALAAVRTGLAEVRLGKVTEGPDLDADAALVAKLKE